MKKSQIFLLIVILGIVGRYILYPIVVFLFKATVGLVIGAGVIALIALLIYVGRETAKHN
jgi:hypothetical protein